MSDNVDYGKHLRADCEDFEDKYNESKENYKITTDNKIITNDKKYIQGNYTYKTDTVYILKEIMND